MTLGKVLVDLSRLEKFIDSKIPLNSLEALLEGRFCEVADLHDLKRQVPQHVAEAG